MVLSKTILELIPPVLADTVFVESLAKVGERVSLIFSKQDKKMPLS